MVDVRSLDMLYGACRDEREVINTHTAHVARGGCGSQSWGGRIQRIFLSRVAIEVHTAVENCD